MDFEEKVPEWEAQGTEPPTTLKVRGFEAGYKPPAAFFNWFWNGVSRCLTEIRTKLSGHASDKENPHGVTKAQIGLNNVDNTADVDKNVNSAKTADSAGKVSKAARFVFGDEDDVGAYYVTFDGSVSRTIYINPEKIGAAAKDLSNVDLTTFKQTADNAGVGGIPVASAETTDFANYTATIPGVTDFYTGLIITVIPAAESVFTDNPMLDVNGIGLKPVAMLGSENSGDMYMPGTSFFSYGCPVTLRYLAEYEDGVWVVIGQHKQLGIPTFSYDSSTSTLSITTQ